MDILAHVFIFAAAAGVTWFCAGMLIESVDRTARRFNARGFTVAFFVLGLLTSLSEISVALNASIEGVPEVSVGNLVGASFTLLLGVVPLLAIVGRGVALKHVVSNFHLQVALVVIAVPVCTLFDGYVSVWEGIIALVTYAALFITLRRNAALAEVSTEGVFEGRNTLILDSGRIVVGAVLIFVAGHFLVEQAVYIASLLNVSGSLVGLVLLALGTNIPEMTIALRAFSRKLESIAFGDYLGSAAANTLIFGLVALFNAPFEVTVTDFFAIALLLLPGLFLFYAFAKSSQMLSRKEGVMLLGLYGIFLVIQLLAMFHVLPGS